MRYSVARGAEGRGNEEVGSTVHGALGVRRPVQPHRGHIPSI